MIEIFFYENGVQKAKISDLKNIKNKQLWIDITDISEEEKELIQKTFELHPLTAEDLFNSNIRVKVEDFPHYLFCVFYGIASLESIEMVELDYIIGDNFLITNHKKDIESYNKLKNDKERLSELFEKGNVFLFHKLLDNEVDNYFPALEKIDDLIETIEEEIAKKPKPELLSSTLKLKRQIVEIKKITLPQREKISFLAKNDYKFIPQNAIPYFRDIYDHSIKVSDSIDNYREAVGNTFDAYMSAVSNSMNEVMKVLSIIATIALPLTVISGIYGTNFTNLPGSSFIYGFWIMIFIMILLSASMVLYFKKRKWF
ncbi:MAG: magnesium/cobalt transporter CorA [Methanocellales archaeon]|nr:magnesium/cobalt transporter CorA [Methanocellales archaeon]MDD3291117.1 magnesium/cobalt transporter CorA [Methanocellales archaeon]MDD5235002.1 magnesium/cobalt transporter CorA [Methanocellales archaeon]MDD5484627.1 magnesium/cobalt transporter CorA [Methanocellales archaeon]